MNEALNQFLASVECKAYRMAHIALRNHADALDMVQEAMIKLVQKYSEHDAQEWKPLFYKILQTKLLDCHRRQAVRNRVFAWLPGKHDESDDASSDTYTEIEYASTIKSPEDKLRESQAIHTLESALQKLSLRQQQVFLLRNWEGLDVAETALAMNCSQGSVKTHYSRAIQSLREQLEDVWP